MRNVLLALILVVGLSGCMKSTTYKPWTPPPPETEQQIRQRMSEFRNTFTEQEIILIDATIRQKLAYPASAKLTGWAVLNAATKTGMVAVEATNTFGTQRTFKLFLYQVNPDGTVIAEPYVRGML